MDRCECSPAFSPAKGEMRCISTNIFFPLLLILIRGLESKLKIQVGFFSFPTSINMTMDLFLLPEEASYAVTMNKGLPVNGSGVNHCPSYLACDLTLQSLILWRFTRTSPSCQHYLHKTLDLLSE